MRSAAQTLMMMVAALLISGCSGDSSRSNADAAADPTAGEAAELSTAADRLDARAPSPGAEGAAQLESEVRERLATEPQ